MNDTIRDKLAVLPEAPGIYRMLDAGGRVIYIGKSKCLKERVNSYFVQNPVWEKAKKMVPFIKDITYVVTPTHLEAMLLECQMIKEVKPYFNSMMKNDKRYVYLKVGEDCRKKLVAVADTKSENCFGPFRSRNRAEDVIRTLEYFYPIDKKRNTYGFEYHMFPEVMAEEIYRKNRKNLLEILQNPEKMHLMIQEIEKKMQRAARQEKYELASRYRDSEQILKYADRTLNTWRDLLESELIYSVPADKGYRIFYIKDGLVFGKKSVKNLGKQVFDQMIDELDSKEIEKWEQLSDKEKMDYRAIVYRELEESGKDRIYRIHKD